MKHLRSFNEGLIEYWKIKYLCNKYGIYNYTINTDGSIDVNGNVYLSNKKLTKLPLKFNIVSEDFFCCHNQLTSLEGSPREIGGDFSCSHNQLTSLEGGPKEVGGYFNCINNNKLTTLEGGPTKIGGNVYYEGNPLPYIILNSKYLKKILTEGDDFYIWKKGKLDMSSFEYMIDVFKDEDTS